MSIIQHRNVGIELQRDTFAELIKEPAALRDRLKSAAAGLPVYLALQSYVASRANVAFGSAELILGYSFRDDGAIGLSVIYVEDDGEYKKRLVLAGVCDPLIITPEMLQTCATIKTQAWRDDPVAALFIGLRDAYYKKCREAAEAKALEQAAAKAAAQQKSNLRAKYKELYALFDGQDPETMSPEYPKNKQPK